MFQNIVQEAHQTVRQMHMDQAVQYAEQQQEHAMLLSIAQEAVIIVLQILICLLEQKALAELANNAQEQALHAQQSQQVQTLWQMIAQEDSHVWVII